MNTIEINISRDYSITPGASLRRYGDFSGEEFRERFLEPHFKNHIDNYKLRIILDGTYGYSASFLEEAFGGLSRKYDSERVLNRLEFVSEEELLLVKEILEYIN